MDAPSPAQRQFSSDGGSPRRFFRTRFESITGVLGQEGNPLPSPLSHAGQSIGVFTSGGDSQGKSCLRINLLIYFLVVLTFGALLR